MGLLVGSCLICYGTYGELGTFFGEFSATPSKDEPYIMHMSDIGKIVDEEWIDTFEKRTDMNLSMGPFKNMPDHFHAIITIGKTKYNSPGGKYHSRSTSKNKFGPQSKNLGSIMRGFKSKVTSEAQIINPDFAWQPRYHDRIIRNYTSYINISNYIYNNVLTSQAIKVAL